MDTKRAAEIGSPRNFSERVRVDNALCYLKQLENELCDLHAKREKVYREASRSNQPVIFAEYKTSLNNYDKRIKEKEHIIKVQRKKLIVSEMDHIDDKLATVKNLMNNHNIILIDEIMSIKERLQNLRSVVLDNANN